MRLFDPYLVNDALETIKALRSMLNGLYTFVETKASFEGQIIEAAQDVNPVDLDSMKEVDKRVREIVRESKVLMNMQQSQFGK